MQSILLRHEGLRRARQNSANSDKILTVIDSNTSEKERQLLQMVNDTLLRESVAYKQGQLEEETIAAVVGDIVHGVKRCAEYSMTDLPPTSSPSSSISPSSPSTSSYSSSSTSTAPSHGMEVTEEEDCLPFEKSIMRNTTEKNKQKTASLKFLSWRKGSIEKLISDNDAISRSQEKTLKPQPGAERAAHALETLTSTFLAIMQILQLRFQMKGAAHFELLGHMVDGGDDKIAGERDEKDEMGERNEGKEGKEGEEGEEERRTDSQDGVVTPTAVYQVRPFHLSISILSSLPFSVNFIYLPLILFIICSLCVSHSRYPSAASPPSSSFLSLSISSLPPIFFSTLIFPFPPLSLLYPFVAFLPSLILYFLSLL